MDVKELKEKLGEMPDDAEVVMEDNFNPYNYITNVVCREDGTVAVVVTKS